MRDARRVGSLCGVLFSVLFIVTVFLVGDTGSDAADSARILGQDANRFFAAFMVGTLSAAALLGFFATMRELMRDAAPDRRILASVLLAGASAAAALLPGSLVVMFGAAEAASESPTSPEVANMVMNVQYGFLVAGFMMAGLAIFCAALGLLRSGVLPVWLCWAGVVVGALQLFAFAFFTLLLVVLWVLVAGVVLLVGAGPVAASASTPELQAR